MFGNRPPPPAPPSFSEFVAAMSAIQKPEAPEGRDVLKLITTAIGGILVALCLWMGSTVSSLSTGVATMSANLSGVQKAIADLQQTQSTASTQMTDLKANDARQDAHGEAQDADISRIKERLRILEGQRTLPVPGAHDEPR